MWYVKHRGSPCCLKLFADIQILLGHSILYMCNGDDNKVCWDIKSTFAA